MSNKTHLASTTALAVAIAAALAAAPAAYSAGKKPVFSKPSAAYGSKVKSIPQEQYNSFIISFKKGTRPTAAALKKQLDAVGRGLGVRIAATRVTGTGAQVIQTSRKLDDIEHKRLVVELGKHPAVRAVEANGRMYRALEPNDPMYADQWHYHDSPMGINVEDAWDSYNGNGIAVSVVDTGQVNHAELAGQFVPGYDFITDPTTARDGDGRDANPNDEGDWDDKYDSSWHGTHVSGTIGALTDNNVGVAGVAHGATVQHVRVLGMGGGTFEDVADGIVWASGGTIAGVPDNPTPADVINVSLGGGGACSTLMQDAMDLAVGNGSVVVVAAGNSSGDVANFQPASCDGVVTVAGTGPNNTPYASTNFGEEIEVAAPAGSGVQPAEDQVLSTLNTGTTVQAADSYAWYAGTSMATPHVVGTVALMLEAAGGPGSLTSEEVTEILVNTAYDTNGLIPGCDTAGRWCSSLIDATKATAVADGSLPLPPAPPGPPPPPPPTELENGVPVELGTMADEAELFFYLDVPATATELTFEMTPGTGATGDSDLYTLFGELPDASTYDCRPFDSGVTGEICTYPGTDPELPAPQEGRYYVRIHAWSPSTGYTLTGTYTEGGGWALAARHVFALKQHRTRVLLEWEPSEATQVDVLFNGAVVGTTANDGTYTHTFRQQGTGTVTYQVCDAGSTTECSAEIDVDYQSRP